MNPNFILFCQDLLAGITHIKHANAIANQHRRKQAFLGSRLAGYVVSTFHLSGVGFIKGMTEVERHAELVYAESLFEKALLGIVYSGDWLAFIKEAYVVVFPLSFITACNKPLFSLNMRTTIAIYRQLGQFLDHMDAAYTTSMNSSKPLCDPSIDLHFRSGVYLGVGMCNIILSMMPGRLMTLVELFGYKGDRKIGLELLMKAGGWVENSDEPEIGTGESFNLF
jgi:hypothetical protein